MTTRERGVMHDHVEQAGTEMRPYVVEYRPADLSQLDLSFLLERPAGKGGFVTIRDGHLIRPSGERLRLWGVNITEWSPGSVMLPTHADARRYAAALARFGVNCVRLHFLDLPAPRGLIDDTSDTTQSFDREQLDHLDYWVAQLKRHGIYCDLNLVVGRCYKAGDGVRDYAEVGWAKALTYFDPRLIELQQDYARQLLTHYNPYTRTEYRHEPAIVIVELVNENSLVEAWVRGRLHPGDQPSDSPNWRSIPASYAAQLDERYATYIAALPGEQQDRLRALAGIVGERPIPRLRAEELATAPHERFHIEAAFYMELERDYFRTMRTFLRDELGVRSLLIGSSDHAHDLSGYPHLWANAQLNIIDGHVYWQPPESTGPTNTPMVNDPYGSTVVQLARTAVAGKPYTVSEVNHPFPHDYACEGIPTLAAYGRLQDWDGIMWYTFEPKSDPGWSPSLGDAFDLSLDPVKMAQLAAGALMFLRGDVAPARTTVARSYTPEQVRASLLLPNTEQPIFTPGFPGLVALQHQIRISSLNGPAGVPPWTQPAAPFISDTGELQWQLAPDGCGLITVDTPCSQALIGFVGTSKDGVTHLAVNVANTFCAITLSSLDDQPIAHATRLLLTTGGRVENTGQRWDAARRRLLERGGAPTRIEPVRGQLLLRGLDRATAILVQPLDGAGLPRGNAALARAVGDKWQISIGDPATPWYVLTIKREAAMPEESAWRHR
ncbi:MAG: hypothetical protein OHK0015_48090 [Chloroflexi bacterium OHK40]